MRVGLTAFSMMVLGACAKEASAPVGTSLAYAAVPNFSYDSLDARPVSSQAFHGKTTVLVFATTWDFGSQAQISYLVKMAEHDGNEVNYAMVAMQDASSRELVEQYVSVMHIPFPVAMAEAATVHASGAFGDVSAVPTVVVMDANGVVVFRSTGVFKSAELRAHFPRPS